jgi:hypothetical protein
MVNQLIDRWWVLGIAVAMVIGIADSTFSNQESKG